MDGFLLTKIYFYTESFFNLSFLTSLLIKLKHGQTVFEKKLPFCLEMTQFSG